MEDVQSKIKQGEYVSFTDAFTEVLTGAGSRAGVAIVFAGLISALTGVLASLGPEVLRQIRRMFLIPGS
jgi:hypothetical protein